MQDRLKGSFDNAGSDADADGRRSGGSANDPHGGYETLTGTMRGPDPDPIGEMPTVDDRTQDDRRGPPHLAGGGDVPRPGFGPTELTPPQIEGDPELGIDPATVSDVAPGGTGRRS